VPCVLWVKMFQRRLVSTEKKYIASEELHEILRNSGDEEYVEDKGRRWRKQYTSKRGNWWWAWSKCCSEGRRFTKRQVTASCTANQTFICKCAMHWRSKTGVSREGKPVTLFPLIQVYEMTQNMFHQFQKQFNYSSGRKWWKKAVLNQRSNWNLQQ